MSKISRSEYQKVCEENKRLKKDLEMVTSEGISPEKILLIGKWRKHFADEKKLAQDIRDLILMAR